MGRLDAPGFFVLKPFSVVLSLYGGASIKSVKISRSRSERFIVEKNLDFAYG